MGLTLLTAPTVWPVTLEEARAHCRVRSNDEDALIQGYIRAATKMIELSLGISIATQTWKLTLDEFSNAIELPRGPVLSVDSVEYYDAEGAAQTVSTALYTADLSSDPQWVVLNSDEAWPDVLDGVNAVSVTYTAGMIEDEDLRHAILLLIGHWHGNREAVNVGSSVTSMPFAVEALMQPYRKMFV